MKSAVLLVRIAAALFFAGCLPSGCKAQSDEVPGLNVALKAMPNRDYCDVTLTATNNREGPMELQFASSRQYDFYARDARGAVVWQWSQDKMFTQALTQKTLGPGESWEITERWNCKRESGARAEGGRYLLIGVITTQTDPVESEPVEVQVSGEIFAVEA